MLPVDKMIAFPRFACLKEKRIAIPSFGKPVEGEHPARHEPAPLTDGPGGHKHEPVGCAELAVATGATPADILVCVAQENAAVHHGVPFAGLHVQRVHGRKVRQPAGP